ncbi:MAG: hypothetical protein ACRD18_05660, partial [Terriglobia bacterium]
HREWRAHYGTVKTVPFRPSDRTFQGRITNYSGAFAVGASSERRKTSGGTPVGSEACQIGDVIFGEP